MFSDTIAKKVLDGDFRPPPWLPVRMPLGPTFSMYADDTSLCQKSNDITQLNKAIDNDQRHLDTWLHGNKLFINVAKRNSMLIITKQRLNILKDTIWIWNWMFVKVTWIGSSPMNIYFGVQIDSSVDWKEQFKVTFASGKLAFLNMPRIFYQGKLWKLSTWVLLRLTFGIAALFGDVVVLLN